MTLGENMQKLLKMYSEAQTYEERQKLAASIQNALSQCEDVNEIREVINLEPLLLPDTITRFAFEKLLKMGERNWGILAGYAAHLLMFYHPKSEEAILGKKLLAEANRLRAEEQQAPEKDNR